MPPPYRVRLSTRATQDLGRIHLAARQAQDRQLLNEINDAANRLDSTLEQSAMVLGVPRPSHPRYRIAIYPLYITYIVSDSPSEVSVERIELGPRTLGGWGPVP
jgi:hypothetical protein